MNIAPEEKQRQQLYSQWEKDKSYLKSLIEGTPTNVKLPELAKSLNTIALAAQEKGMSNDLCDFSLQLPLEGAQAMNYKDFHKYVMRKAMDPECQVGFKFKGVKVGATGANPYEHPLTKSLGITPLDTDFLSSHSILTPAAYESLCKGLEVGDKGVWNTDLEKAVKNLAQYKKVRKLIHRNGKTFIATYYVSSVTGTPHPTQAPDEVELEDDPALHDLAKNGLDVGDEIVIPVNGVPMKATIRRFENDGSVRLLLEDGKKTNKRFIDFAKMVQNGQISIVKANGQTVVFQQPNKAAILQFPAKLSDLTMVKHLGGSTGADLMEDKDGNQFVVKKGANPEQAVNEQLSNDIYRAIGVNAPQSQMIDGAMVSQYVGNVNDINNANQTLTDTLRTQLEQNFVAHCLLANHDIVENDNTQYDPVDGRVWHLDNGGTMFFRAQGARKNNFSSDVAELQTMRNHTGNQQKWFGRVSEGDVVAQIENDILPNRTKIHDLIKNNPNLDPKEKVLLMKTMKERVQYLEDYAQKYHLKTQHINKPITIDVNTATPEDVVKANTTKNNYNALDLDILEASIAKLKKANRGKDRDDSKGFYDMNALCCQRGFDNKPVVLAHADFEALMLKTKNDDKVELAYRTVGRGYEDKFKNDPEFYTGGQGASLYGAGIYFAAETSKSGLKAVPPPPSTHSFNDSRGYGQVTHYALFPENFKWAEEDKIRAEIHGLKSNTIPNPAYDKAHKDWESADGDIKSYAKNFADNIFKTHGYDKGIGEHIAHLHTHRNWKEANVHELAGIIKQAGGKADMHGQTMLIETAPAADGTVYKDSFTFTGDDGTHKYNTMVKGFYNRVFDNYVTPMLAKADTKNLVSDPHYKKLQTKADTLFQTRINTPPTIAGKMSKEDKKFLDILDDHGADNSIGLFAAYRGYDGIKTNSSYRTIFNRSKVIVSDKDYL